MIIEIPKLGPEGATFAGEEPQSLLGLEQDRMAQPEGPIQYELHAEVVSSELLVQGSLSVPMKLCCAKCADFFSTRVQVLSFLRAYALTAGTESVDITEDIREEILLNLPAFPLCATGCKGLCPQCGKDLNEGPCACKPAAGFSPWAALATVDLSFKKSPE